MGRFRARFARLLISLAVWVVAGCLILPPWALAAPFNITRDFEGGTVGQIADTHPSGFDGADFNCTFSADLAKEGTKSAKNHLVEGSQGANHGGHVNVTVVVGEEFWAGAYLYLKSPWSWVCQPPCGEGSEVKVMRAHLANSSPAFWHTLVTPSNGTPYINLDTTGQNHHQNRNLPATTLTTFDQWIWVEWYIKFATGTGGTIRMWINGILKLEHTGIATANSGGSIDQANFFVYWNSGPDITQDVYIDRLRVTNDPASSTQTDADGNKMIGPLSQGPPLPPAAPTSLRVF